MVPNSAFEIFSGPLLMSVVQPRFTLTPAVCGTINSLPAALIADPVVVARAALFVIIVTLPAVVALPITLAKVVHEARPRLPEPVPSVAFRKILPPFAVIV